MAEQRGGDPRSNESSGRNGQRKTVSNDQLQPSGRNNNAGGRNFLHRGREAGSRRVNNKWNLSSSDYDGQLSDE